jgi:hypothetical protein
MADIKNYTLNFVVRRPRSAGLTCAVRELLCQRAALAASSERAANG